MEGALAQGPGALHGLLATAVAGGIGAATENLPLAGGAHWPADGGGYWEG